MPKLPKKRRKLIKYTPVWRHRFQKERDILQELLGDDVLLIEHIGSTAIPGLSVRSVMDIAVGVDCVEALQRAVPLLTEAGYDVLDRIEKYKMVLAKKMHHEYDAPTHYIHIEIVNGESWNNQIMFRDYLLSHPECVEEYDLLKQSLSDAFRKDHQKYTNAKNAFIERVLKTAAEEKEKEKDEEIWQPVKLFISTEENGGE